MKYIPALVAISLGLIFVCSLIVDIALAHRGSGRDKLSISISKTVMPGDGRRDDKGDDS